MRAKRGIPDRFDIRRRDPRLRLAWLAGLLVVALLIGSCANTDWQTAATPNVAAGSTVVIRVAHAINPRLPEMSPAQIEIMLDAARKTVLQHFGVRLQFTQVTNLSLAQLFGRLPESVRSFAENSVYDFKNATGDRERFESGLTEALRERGAELDDMRAFAAPYLGAAPAPEINAFARQLSDVMLERLDSWKSLTADDGAAVIDASPYNEWTYWDLLGYGRLAYDLVITNQLIASAEYYGVDVHTALRGGMTAGTTSFSADSPYHAYVFWSTFAYTDNSNWVKKLRGGESYTQTRAAELAGTYLAHEIGHQLHRLGHPFGRTACVMNPVSMLEFERWVERLDSAACAVGSDAQMSIGAARIYYRADWLERDRANQ